jgi:uncharacterized protein (TIGR02453 family)
MLQTSTVQFLNDLEANNNRPWFEENKARYLEAKADFEGLVEAVRMRLAQTEPAFADQSIKQSTFRIYRDVRFSTDKTPYKSHFGLYFNPRGKQSNVGGFYVQLQPGDRSFAAGGAFMPQSQLLKDIRQEIDYNQEEWLSIVESADFKGYFDSLGGKSGAEKLSTAPKGYAKDHPLIEYLKLKSFEASHSFEDKLLSSPKLLDYLMDGYEHLQPFNQFLLRVAASEVIPEKP